MSSTLNRLIQAHNKIRSFSTVKRRFTVGKIIYNKPSGASTEVPGLSEAVVRTPNNPVGPGAAKNTNYKNPEYFCYDKMSYFEAEVEMLQFRCPQPSTKVPYHQNIPK